jgi:Tubulin-tyrosine ligase family
LQGYDILLDEACKAWLLEVNHSPSFSVDSCVDAEVKEGLIRGALDIVGIDAQARRKRLMCTVVPCEQRDVLAFPGILGGHCSALPRGQRDGLTA